MHFEQLLLLCRRVVEWVLCVVKSADNENRFDISLTLPSKRLILF